MNTTTTSSLPLGAAAPATAARRAMRWPWVLLAIALASGLLFVLKGYQLFQATMVLAYAIALLGLNMLTGYNGQISLGHGAFFALGAYAAGILMEHAGAPYWATVPAAAVVCLAVGYLFGRPALKLEGLYLALATFALGVAMPQLLKYKHLEAWTGGVQGIVLIKPDAPFGLPLSQDQWLYVFALGVTVVMFLIAHNLLSSGTGRAMRAIRDHAMAAEAMGVDNRHYKSMTFGVSAAYTGVGGARCSSSRPTRSRCFCPSRCWWASWWAAWARCGARSSAPSSSCLCPTWPSRCPRRRPGRFMVWC